MSDEVPEGWAQTVLSLVAELVTGSTPPTKEARFYNGGTILFVKPGDLGSTRPIESTEACVTREGALHGRQLPSGSSLVCCIGTLGKVGFLGRDAICNQQINAAIPTSAVEPRYLFHWLSTLTPWLDEHASETTIRIVNKGRFSKAPVRLAPRPEQRRIVEKVEALLEQVNRAKERLDRVFLILKRFRQAVLAAACSGELTRTWREEHSSRANASSSSRKTLLKDQRRQLWASRKPGLSTRKYSEPFDVEPPFELPDGWEWVTVSSLALLDVGFAFKSTDFTEDGVRLLRGENVEPGALRWIDTRFLPKSKIDPERHHSVEAGEIILALDRPIVAAGLKIARVRESDLPALLVQRVMRFKMVDRADTDFLFYCLRDKRFIDFVAHEGMTGSDLPHITGTGVAEFPVPLPPRDEQVELVRRIKSMFTLADTIERRVQAAAVRANKLPQAILSKAFSGELVPTEAELARLEGRIYETAEELLKKVTALGSEVPPTHGKGTGRRPRKSE